jgi:hypothetical protein
MVVKLKMVNKMLRIIGCIVFVCLNLKCVNKYNDQGTAANDDSSYHVYKIDSVNSFYLIYASRKGAKYKNVSEKKSCANRDKVLRGRDYDFDLSSMLYGSEELPIHPGGVGGVIVDSVTTIFVEDSIYDLYSAKNVIGLCFIKEE